MIRSYRWLPAVLLALFATGPALADDDVLAREAQAAMKKAVQFFRTQVAVEGSYLWRYSADLKLREGEGKAGPTTAWVQPPGTPSVGLAYVRAYQATNDPYYLEAARETAMALVKGQLRSGGWDYRIEFDPKQRLTYAYRVQPGNPKGRNSSTLDDDNTQEALRLLMRVDRALDFKDKTIHEAAAYALSALLKAQYPNGGWPQRFETPPDPKKFPVKKASFPESWPRTWPKPDYRGYYTLNDHTQADMIDVMFEAGQIYGDKRYTKSALQGGDFLILAQMPEPQPAWAQQYDFDMHPAWARRFEPPAVTGGESQGVMRTLLALYRKTGDKKYLEPLPKAIAYFRKVQLPDGRLARFYELKTSKPLYFTKEYELTYKDDDVPTHYAFKIANRIDDIAREYERLRKLDPKQLQAKPQPPRVTSGLRSRAQQAIDDLDAQGRWTEQGVLRTHDRDKRRQIISCQTFIRNLDALSAFLRANRGE